MDLLARSLLENLLSAGEKAKAGRRSRPPALTRSYLAEYQQLASLPKKESFEATMRAARAEGAVDLTLENTVGEMGFIQRIALIDIRALAKFLGVTLVEDKVSQAETLLIPFADQFPVIKDVLHQWAQLRTVRGLKSDSVQDWIDAIKTIDYGRKAIGNQNIELPIREASAKLFNDSKRIEKLSASIDVLLANSVDAEKREAASVWQELGLFREEQPARLAGNVVIERDRVCTVLDKPYIGLNANAILRLVTVPQLVMTIENLTTFHSEARRCCDDDVLLIYTAGMPSPTWRSMYQRLIKELPNSVPIYHWGDIDEGGFRIAATLAQDTVATGHVLRPWRMYPTDVPDDKPRRKATTYTIEKIMYFAALAGWQELGKAVANAGFTIEQENLAKTGVENTV